MDAIKEMIYKMADDELMMGHRSSEWTGIGPTLEEDIAFSSMSQDKVGHALALYSILHKEFGEKAPDKLAFDREEKAFKCCHLVEFHTEDYARALVRHFFFDHAEYLRYNMLSDSSRESLKKLARKIKGELKYHVMHADVWMKKLGPATEESHSRMQSAVNDLFPLALGIFEPGNHENELKDDGVFDGEEALRDQWLNAIKAVLDYSGLELPSIDSVEPAFGGRKGIHTEDFGQMLKEMTEVYKSEPVDAQW